MFIIKTFQESIGFVKGWVFMAPLFYLVSCVIQYNVMNVYYNGGRLLLTLQILENFYDVYSFSCMISLLDTYEKRQIVLNAPATMLAPNIQTNNLFHNICTVICTV